MNALALAFVKKHEGCRLEAYRDIGGVWTIGYGCTGPAVKAGLVWSQEEADAQLAAELERAEAALQRHVRVALPDHALAALISFVFNLGEGAFAKSLLRQFVNDRNMLAAAKEFIRWDHVGRGEVKGLLVRRLQEALLFLKGE